MSEEKTLTDEEIVKVLECCSKSWDCNNCKRDKENNNRFICSENLLKNCLDLIHRLQDDYSNLKERYVKVLGLNEKVIAEQKAEIERLTEESNEMFDRHAKENQAASILIEKRNNEIAELQKQVDELKEERENMQAEIIETEELRLQAVKDTAKKIFNGIIENFVFAFIGASKDYEQGYTDALKDYDKQLRDFAKKEYGIEVGYEN